MPARECCAAGACIASLLLLFLVPLVGVVGGLVDNRRRGQSGIITAILQVRRSHQPWCCRPCNLLRSQPYHAPQRTVLAVGCNPVAIPIPALGTDMCLTSELEKFMRVGIIMSTD